MKIDISIHDEWLFWQKKEFIPEVMATGLFVDYKFFHLLNLDESDGVTYVVQYFTRDIDHYQKYIDDYSEVQLRAAIKKWGDLILTFDTVMEVVQ